MSFQSICETVIGGILLALIFFALKEWIFRLPDLSGRRYFRSKVLKSRRNPYLGMELTYVTMLWQEGNFVRGSGEKISEKQSGKQRKEYSFKQRTPVIIEGYITKRYLWFSDRIIIHIDEIGKKRKTSTSQILQIPRFSKKLSGAFFSTAADSEGTVEWFVENPDNK